MLLRYIHGMVLLLSSSYHIKLCENLRDEDNFNNTLFKNKTLS